MVSVDLFNLATGSGSAVRSAALVARAFLRNRFALTISSSVESRGFHRIRAPALVATQGSAED